MMNTSISKSNKQLGLLLASLSIIISSCSINWLDVELNSLSGSVQSFGTYLECAGTLDGVLVDEDTWVGLESAPLTMCIIKKSNKEIAFIINIYTGRSLYCFPENDSYWELSTSSITLKGYPKDVTFDTTVPISFRPRHKKEIHNAVNASIKGWINSDVAKTKTQLSLDKYEGDIIITWQDPGNTGSVHELHIYEFSDRLSHQ